MMQPNHAGPELADQLHDFSVSDSPTRPLYWSIRREIWENRSIYLAPIAAACVNLIGTLVGLIGLVRRRKAILLLDPVQQRIATMKPYDLAAAMVVLTMIVVGVFYCLEALHGERRDRSILFWKSLPLSDRTAVLAKAAIPLAILPGLAFAIIMVTQQIILVLSDLVLWTHGLSAAFNEVSLLQHWGIVGYSLVTLALWHAPIYGWLLMVSAWSRRATFLWATLPLLAICAFEKIVFGGTHFVSLLKYRMGGFLHEGFNFDRGAISSWSQLTFGRFLMAPGLWLGLAFAALFLSVAIHLRRSREPV